ncbi:PLP-dependent aspartate aminotransferase family protein [Citrobacter koseri]|uniref:trans-sulfuration enzyme family protein n=1 Tax=Citrobacter koseri TaxID=545 RepID=UPI002B393F86|nr:PLP-dependent aspartate aminotransferase family protein [Citrobacter koseri]MEB2704026.1 PLP-dependent aspartate aminotransferase family protein [Citrobacter koseri]MEB2709593.1 PLP-dependent aspartate aminotransferase family protein [Citrobacter koseri]
MEINTICVHSGNSDDDFYGALHTPIYLTSNYRLPTYGTPVDWSGIHSNIYARNRNVNQTALEDKLKAIEEAEDCATFASGAAALHAVFATLLKKGDHVICSQVCYSSVNILFREILPEQLGIEVSMIDTTDAGNVRSHIKSNTRMIHIETPGNPTTGISDIGGIASLTSSRNILLSVDGTFASPLYQKPLALGADLVIHSMTKYINGHGDALGGCVLGNKSLIEKIKLTAMVNFGGILSPFNAYLINRGLVTLPLRMKQHSDSAHKVAVHLSALPCIKFAYYPGLESHPQHAIAARQMQGYSGMISFALKGDEKINYLFLNALSLISHAVSLGDGETLIVYNEVSSEKIKYYPEEFHKGFFRLSIGLEDPDDIIEDINMALTGAGLI